MRRTGLGNGKLISCHCLSQRASMRAQKEVGHIVRNSKFGRIHHCLHVSVFIHALSSKHFNNSCLPAMFISGEMVLINNWWIGFLSNKLQQFTVYCRFWGPVFIKLMLIHYLKDWETPLQRLNANVLLKYTKSTLFYFFILSLTYNAFHGEEGVYLISTEVVILRQTHGAKVSGQEVSSKWEWQNSKPILGRKWYCVYS